MIGSNNNTGISSRHLSSSTFGIDRTSRTTTSTRLDDLSMIKMALPSVQHRSDVATSSCLTPVPVPANNDEKDGNTVDSPRDGTVLKTTTRQQRQRQRQRRTVQFKDPVKIPVKKRSRRRKQQQRHQINDGHDGNDSSRRWYIRTEIKGNHKSIIKASRAFEQRKNKRFASFTNRPFPAETTASSFQIKKKRTSVLSMLTSSSTKTQNHDIEDEDNTNDDAELLKWFSSDQRNQRKRKRNQIHETMKAVREFEMATHTNYPDMLAQLLQRQSQPAVEEAVRIASSTAVSSSYSAYESSSSKSSLLLPVVPRAYGHHGAYYSKHHQQQRQQPYHNPVA